LKVARLFILEFTGSDTNRNYKGSGFCDVLRVRRTCYLYEHRSSSFPMKEASGCSEACRYTLYSRASHSRRQLSSARSPLEPQNVLVTSSELNNVISRLLRIMFRKG